MGSLKNENFRCSTAVVSISSLDLIACHANLLVKTFEKSSSQKHKRGEIKFMALTCLSIVIIVMFFIVAHLLLSGEICIYLCVSSDILTKCLQNVSGIVFLQPYKFCPNDDFDWL